MPATTACASLQYPLDTDPIDVAGDIQKLAEDVDVAICGRLRNVGEVFTMYVPAAAQRPTFTNALVCDGTAFDPAVYPALSSYLGASNTPNFNGRFLRQAGGAFPTDAQVGGSDDAVVVSHSHTQPQHRHTINHDHPSFNATGGSHAHSINHNHPSASTNTTGNHSHNSGWLRSSWVWTGSGSSNYGNTAFGTNINTGSAGNHSHTLDVPNYSGSSGTSTSHTHAIDVPNYSGNSGYTTPTTNNAGESGTNKNIPPFVNVVFYMQAA